MKTSFLGFQTTFCYSLLARSGLYSCRYSNVPPTTLAPNASFKGKAFKRCKVV